MLFVYDTVYFTFLGNFTIREKIIDIIEDGVFDSAKEVSPKLEARYQGFPID